MLTARPPKAAICKKFRESHDWLWNMKGYCLREITLQNDYLGSFAISTFVDVFRILHNAIVVRIPGFLVPVKIMHGMVWHTDWAARAVVNFGNIFGGRE
jgi:hypothetical protein